MPDELPPDFPDFDEEPDWDDEAAAEFDPADLPSLEEVLGISLAELGTVLVPADVAQTTPTRLAVEAATAAELVAPLRAATDAAELAAVLNAALRLEAAEYPKRKIKPVSFKTLNYFAYHKAEQRYRTFAIPKKTPGETREIKAPAPGLLRVQRLLLRCLTAAFTTCDSAAHGFVSGRSVRTNAEPHVGRRFVLNLDLKDFFPSTSVKRVVKVLQLTPFELSKPVAHLVANLCCDQGSLPQGAPTSPLLTNVVCQRLDRRLRQLARQHRCVYTRYADDLTFSSNRPAFRESFHAELNEILTSEGYQQNPHKQRLQLPHQRQEVTGVVVNERPNVPREFVRDIRFLLHVWENFGYEAATAKLRQRYPSRVYARHEGKIPKLERVLAGKIAYLGMVRNGDDSTYLSLKAKLHFCLKNRNTIDLKAVLKIWKEQGINAAIASGII
jgi:RNA-directed DNA polymerase